MSTDSVDARVFDGVVSDLEGLVPARIKKSLRMIIKDRKEKGQYFNISDEIERLQNNYLACINKMFTELQSEAFLAGVIQYSGFVERREDDE